MMTHEKKRYRIEVQKAGTHEWESSNMTLTDRELWFLYEEYEKRKDVRVFRFKSEDRELVGGARGG